LDAKLSLLGRLLLRKAIVANTTLSWPDVALGRSDKGKPLLTNVGDQDLAFNVSHSVQLLVTASMSGVADFLVVQGEYAVMVAGWTDELGVDLADVRDPLSSSVARFFELMQDVFTPNEWQHINAAAVPLVTYPCS